MSKPVLQFSLRPVTITVKGIKCLGESDESSDADEIYVIVTAVDLTTAPIPNVRSILTGVWGSVDTGEFHTAVQFPPNTPELTFDTMDTVPVVIARPFWGLDLNPKVIRHQNDVIFFVSCMEHDEGNVNVTREVVQMAATASVASSLGMPRATLVANLRTDIDHAIGTPSAAHFNLDEQIDHSKELRLTPRDILLTVPGGQFEESLFFFGGDEGHVRVDFLFRA